MMARQNDLLAEIDFADLYRKQAKASSFHAHTGKEWGKRAEQRSRREKGNDYAREFLSRMDLTGAQTLLDIGCGSGNLAIPLASRLKKIHALDFSPEMLRLLRAGAREAGVRNISTHALAWRDNWSRLPKVDIAICSRAMGVPDLQAALRKMTRMARLRCYATIHAGASFLSEDVYCVLRRKMIPRPNYMYAINILYQMGIRARVDFLHTSGGLVYDRVEQFVEGIQWRLGALSRPEEKRLSDYFLSLPKDADGTTRYRHDFVWAFLAWDSPTD